MARVSRLDQHKNPLGHVGMGGVLRFLFSKSGVGLAICILKSSTGPAPGNSDAVIGLPLRKLEKG